MALVNYIDLKKKKNVITIYCKIHTKILYLLILIKKKITKAYVSMHIYIYIYEKLFNSNFLKSLPIVIILIMENRIFFGML